MKEKDDNQVDELSAPSPPIAMAAVLTKAMSELRVIVVSDAQHAALRDELREVLKGLREDVRLFA